MSHIRDLLVVRFAETLERDLITSVSRSDPTRADLVKAYRFQAEPQDTPIYLSVTGGDPNDPTLRDARVSAKEQEELGMRIPIGEIGGGHLWWRRGRVFIGCYFHLAKYTQEKAAQYAHQVLGRATNSIERAQVAGLVDTFGEEALLPIAHANVFYEGGGPDNQYIWRGEVHWQVLTARPY